MTYEWPLVTFGELADSVSDTHSSGKESMIFLNTSDILLGNILNHSYSAVRDWPGQAKKSIRRDDILFSEIRPANGRWAYVNVDAEDFVVSTKLMVIRARPRRALPRYLYHFLTSAGTTHSLQQLAESRSGTFPQITFAQVAALELRLPSLVAQAAIAQFLDSISDRIELNCQMNVTLESMAQAVFKSWFVNFDPVRAKMEGREPGLANQLADLFPGRLQNSELGDIPADWRVGRVDDEFELIMGQSPPGETYNLTGNGLPFYQGRTDFGLRFPTRRVYCTAPTRFARAGDTLISVRAPVGDINIASEDCAIGRGVAAARHRTGSRSYTYQFMHGLHQAFERFEAEGTVFGSISKDDFHGLPCLIPPIEAAVGFETMLSPLDRRIEVADRESHTLAALRDALLPKLISGQLRVKDAESLAVRIA